MECFCQTADIDKRQVALTTFDTPDVTSSQPTFKGQALLRPSMHFSQDGQALTKKAQVVGRTHGNKVERHCGEYLSHAFKYTLYNDTHYE